MNSSIEIFVSITTLLLRHGKQ